MTATLNDTPPATTSSAAHRPRVLQVITHLGLGGAEQVCFRLVRQLRPHYQFHVFAANGILEDALAQQFLAESHELAIPHSLGTKIPNKRGGVIFNALALGRTIKAFQPDLIQLHTEIPEATYCVLSVLQPRVKKIPVLRTVHNSNLWPAWQSFGKWCEKKLSHASAVCVSTAAQKAFIRHRADAGDTRPQSHPPAVIYNGVASATNWSADHKTYPAPGETLHLLFAGRFEEQKGADILPAIVRHVGPIENRPVHLHVHGTGTHEATLKTLAQNPPPGWTITVEGPIANLQHHLSRFHLVVMPSRFEGLPLVAIEALAAAVPVVGTSAPGLAEVFPQHHPWAAEPGDAASFAATLKNALTRTETWPAVLGRSLAFAETRFNLAAMADHYHRTYQSILAGAPA